MYNIVADKDKSKEDFKRFLDYMTRERNNLKSMEQETQADFMHHYNKIPEYFDIYIQRYENEIVRNIAQIEMCINRIGEHVKGGIK